ncbi:RNA guanine-N7 methyltransferase activating subunit-like [Dunckerocampus dactyliophorus]|uniref:RNA guanine-N7 methyltransferase activating subunit-like n=1 Tax=Dunckerocampus dactyliophorus TaxID=161453 RepID=UPI002405B117|nr:RNA guanine-N7 methyltransferase activating subunit-like [Dunckerocampus dactyliophorus]
MFANRFTSEDTEYQQYVKRPADPPPIVEGWRGGNHRGRDRRYQDHQGGRGWGRDRYGRGAYHRQQHWQDGDQYGSHGSRSQPNYHQENSSRYQRPHYDRY